MADLLDAIKGRTSCRSYLPDPVSKEDIDKVLEAGRWAPTGANQQTVIAVAVTDPAVIEKFRLMNAAVIGDTSKDPFYGAPCLIIVLAKKERCYIYDGPLAIGYMLLEADSLGLGSCWIHRCKEEFETEEGKEFLKSLGIEGDYEGIGHVILGHIAGEKAAPKPRKEDFAYYVE